MKIFDRGYWISKIFYFQSWPYFIVNAIRFRSMTFFSACNPRISFGGMLDEKKSEIYQFLPEVSIPKTIVFRKNEDVLKILETSKLKFPIILKPNIGYKGYMVSKVKSIREVLNYLNKVDDRELLIQEYIDYQHEYSLLYYRMPNSAKSGISSLIEKKYPDVVGDGQTTLRKLIHDKKNPFINKELVYEKFADQLETIPSEGEKIIIDNVGNYSRGAKFYDMSTSIDHDLVLAADRYFENISGINFCRLDFKAESLQAFKNGDFKIMEINGAKSEPLHIYDPNLSYLSIFKSVHTHWQILRRIVEERIAMSFELPSFRNGLKSYVTVKRLMKS